MKKGQIFKQKMAAVMLSLVLAVTTMIVPSALSAKDVSAAESNQEIFNHLTMAVMISGQTQSDFGGGKGTVDNATAAYYTALKYASQKKTTINADEFCKSMSNNFAGGRTYTKNVFQSVPSSGPCQYDASTNKVTVNNGMGDSLQSYYLGEKKNSDGSSTMYGVWKDWEDDIEPYFIAIKVKSGKIVSYSQIDYEFVMNFNDGYGINVLPKTSITLRTGLSLDGYKSSAIIYRWNCKALNINNVTGKKDSTYGSLYTIPSSKTGKTISDQALIVSACIYNEKNKEYFEIASTQQMISIKNCKLAFSYRHFVGNNTEPGKGTTLNAGDAYWFSLDGADFGWDIGNGSGAGRQTFYKLECKLNGKTLTATDVEKNLKNSQLSIGIGAGGGCPNRIISPKKAGKLTIKATIYQNKKVLKTLSKTYTVKDNSVKKTTLSSAKNVKGKKILVKWKKNKAGDGYQIQYSTTKKFTKGNKTKTISKNKTTSYTIKKLKKKKTYYVRIRTYKKISGKKCYSGWSKVKTVKIRK